MAGHNYMSRGCYTNDGNRTSYGENGYADHVCRPVIASPNNSSESYVTTTTERIVEQVGAPVVVTDYKYSSQAKKCDPLKDYGVTHDKCLNPSNRVYDRTEYGYSSSPKLELLGNSGLTNDNLYSNPSIVGQDCPPKVEDLAKKVQIEVSQPIRTNILSATHWRNTPSSTGQCYGGEDANYNKNNNTPLSGTINEIGQAVKLLKEAVKPSSAGALQSRFPVQSSTTVTKGDDYTGIIDSKEATKRYGNKNLSSRPFQTGEIYTGTIDSREAARKYNGARV